MTRFCKHPLTYLCATAFGASTCLGTQTDRPAFAQRVAHEFDFEEQELHDAPVPLSWYRSQHIPPDRPRPGFPIWNRATIEYQGAYSGEGCVRLPTRGGSTSLRLKIGVVPVLPGAEYTVRAMARAENLRYAHPAIQVFFVNEAGEPIESTRRRQLVRQMDDQWRPIEVLLEEAPSEAAFMRVDLELLQPSAITDADKRLVGDNGFFEDLDGAAWFDDISIMMRPRVSLAAGPFAGVCTPEQPPELIFSARDLAGDRLDASIRIYDIDGIVVDSLDFRVDPSGRPTRWSPQIDSFGWYRAVASVRAGNVPIGTASHDLVLLPEPDLHRPRVGILLGEFDPADANQRVQLARSLGLGEVMLPVWRDQTIASEIESHVEDLALTVDQLRRDRVGVTLMLDRVPRTAAREDMIDRQQIAAFLAGESENMHALLDPILERLGQAVTRWQIGQPDEAWDPTIGADLAAAERILGRLVPGPQILTSLSSADLKLAQGQLDLARPVFLAEMSGAMSETAIEDLAAVLSQNGRAEDAPIRLLVRPLDPTLFGTRASLRSLARQLVWIRAYMDDRIHRVVLDMREESIPGPAAGLAAMVAVSDRLAESRVVGELAVAPGVRCYILQGISPDEPGSLIAWHDGSTPETPVLDAMLSLRDVSVLDLFGNRREVSLSEADIGGIRTHQIEIPQMPIFIEGIDTPLVQFQAQFAMSPNRLQTDNSHHEHTLVFTNPWTSPIDARYFLVKPGGVLENGRRDRNWDISPRTGVLDTLAGETSSLPVRIALSPYQPAGEIQAIVDVELRAERDYGVVRLKRSLNVGVEDLITQVSHRLVDGQLVVDITLASGASDSRDLEILAFAGNDALRQRSVVTDMVPGEFVIRRLVFDPSLVGDRVFVSVLDSLTGSRQNTIIEVGRTLAIVEEP